MIDLNLCVGILLIALGTLALLMSFAIAVRQYVFIPPALGVMGGGKESLFETFVGLLKAILKAPPALAFLVSGLLLLAGAIAILHLKPL